MEEKQPCHPSAVQPPPPPCPTASPVTLRALPYSRRSTLEKIDCLFCLTARELQAAETRAEGGQGAGGLLLIRMDFLLLCL